MEHQVAEKQAFIFTRDGFYPDYADEQATQDPMELLYHISLTEDPAQLTVSGYFLYLVSKAFYSELTELPELEMARDEVEVKLSEDRMTELLAATPYAIGTEHVNKSWLAKRGYQIDEGGTWRIDSFIRATIVCNSKNNFVR